MMSGKVKMVALSLGLALSPLFQGSTPAAAQTGHEGMGHEGMSHQGHAAAPAQPQGTLIRESKVQDTSFVYRLYSWEERNAMMKGMEGHEMPGMDSSGKSTHHLMVFITGADGKERSGGKVGFIVTGPEKSDFKTLTMAMSGGYGADVPFKAKGDYAIKTKAVFGEVKLEDNFTYTVK
jgi:hypothetical protein